MELHIEGSNLKYLNALLTCAGKDDIRHYLNGVFFDHENHKIIASDGHRIATIAMPTDQFFGSESVILPINKPFKKSINKVIISKEGDLYKIETFTKKAADKVELVSPIIGNYPDYKRLMNAYGGQWLDVPALGVCYNWQFLADIQKQLDRIGFQIRFDKDHRCYFQYNNFEFLAMGVRF